ncbi:hypothetical protein [Piscirickettsia salmonis]|uniref:hypothetical protein n=1 Tax=Piscirickettsia salmonis TaxID=1238 RepID=UPI0039F49114
MAGQIHVTMDLKDNLLSLGKALYFYYAAQINPDKKHFIFVSVATSVGILHIQ